jgi:hypothetical protein
MAARQPRVFVKFLQQKKPTFIPRLEVQNNDTIYSGIISPMQVSNQIKPYS